MPDIIADTFGGSMGSILGGLAGLALAPVTGGSSLALGALGSGIGGGIQTGVETGNPLTGLASGLLSGTGSYLGGSYLGPEIAANVTTPLATGITTTANTALDLGLAPMADVAAGNIAGNVLGSVAGGGVGGELAKNVGGEALGLDYSAPAEAWKPTYASGYSMPSSLSNLGSLSKQQQSTGLATQGLYGGGLGGEENKYFLNLINNRLLEQGSENTADQLTPAELSYLDKLGLGGYSTEGDLLKGIETYA